MAHSPSSFSPDTRNPVYFWRPEGETGFLGQWWPSSFKWNGGDETYDYANAEQYVFCGYSSRKAEKSTNYNKFPQIHDAP